MKSSRLSLLALVLSFTFEIYAGTVHKISVCDASLTASKVGFSRIAKTLLSEDDLAMGVTGLSGDWARIGSVLGGLYVNLATLESTDFVRHFGLHNRSLILGNSRYRKIAESPSGRFSVLQDPDIFKPVHLLVNGRSDSERPVLVGSTSIRGLEASSSSIEYNSNESLLAIGFVNDVHIINPESGINIDRYRHEPISFIKAIAWSSTEKNVVFVLNSDFTEIDLVRLKPEEKSTQSLLRIEGEFGSASAEGKYLPRQKKFIVSAAKKNSSELYLVNDVTGDGQVVKVPSSVRGISAAPNEDLFLIYGESSVSVYSSDSLSRFGSIPHDSKAGEISFAAFNAKSQIVVVHSDGSINLYEISSK